MRRYVCVWFIIGFLLAGAAAAAQIQAGTEKTHPFSVHDMLAMDRISDSRVSPDGKWIVFNVRETDLEGEPGTDGYLDRRRGRERISAA